MQVVFSTVQTSFLYISSRASVRCVLKLQYIYSIPPTYAMNRTVIGRRSPDRTTNSRIKTKPMAARRLRQDLLELQRDGICSVAALPLEKNLFEWHVNIKPVDGVYSGVYFHLIMVFPTDYPASPPVVKIKTPISHPNIFGEWLCLSMIKKHTATVPYEGWSGAYSVSSILMQLQSFLFAEKIDQDYGGQANAQLTDQDVNRSLECCKTLKCPCGHSHDTPWPPVKGPPQSMIKIFPSDPQSGHVWSSDPRLRPHTHLGSEHMVNSEYVVAGCSTRRSSIGREINGPETISVADSVALDLAPNTLAFVGVMGSRLDTAERECFHFITTSPNSGSPSPRRTPSRWQSTLKREPFTLQKTDKSSMAMIL